MRKVFVMIAALAMAVSCGKDDDAAKTLHYKGMTVKEFKMYVGSPEGGKEVSLTGKKPEDFFASDMEKSGFKYDYITFDGEWAIFPNGKWKYSFHNDTLRIHEDDDWEAYAIGNTNQLAFPQAYYKVMQRNRETSSGVTDLNLFTLERGLKMLTLSKLSEMTRVTDTILWATCDYRHE